MCSPKLGHMFRLLPSIQDRMVVRNLLPAVALTVAL
jgi:hypothetical protein